MLFNRRSHTRFREPSSPDALSSSLEPKAIRLAEPHTMACFGKVPTYGDFVRYNAGGAAMSALDAWLQRGFYVAQSRRPDELEAACDTGAVYPFYFTSEEAPHALLGVMRLSRDQTGRQYPFLVALEVNQDAIDRRQLPYLPVQFSAFLRRVAHLVQEATDGRLDHHEVIDRVEQLTPAYDDPTARLDQYQNYLKQTSFKTFAERLWGRFDDTRKFVLFKNLIDIVEPLQGTIPPYFSLGMKYPLDAHDPDPFFAVNFWLDLSLGMLDYPAAAPTFFWTMPDPHGPVPPFLLVFLQPPAKDAFVHVLPIDLESDTICMLDQMDPSNAALAAERLPLSYSEMLDSEQFTLWDVIHSR